MVKYLTILTDLRSKRQSLLDISTTLSGGKRAFQRAKKRFSFFDIAKQKLVLQSENSTKPILIWKGKKFPRSKNL